MAYNVIRKAKSLLVRKENVERANSLLIPGKSVEGAKSPLLSKQRIAGSHKSKLMICIEVLCILSSNGPMRLSQLLDRLEMDECRLKPHLRLLWNRGLVEEEILGDNKIRYVVTDRGLSVLKVTGPIIREAQKIQMRNFEAISSALSGTTIISQNRKENKPSLKISDFIKEKRAKWKLSDLIKIEVVKTEEDET